MRGGLELVLTGVGQIVILLTFIPYFAEATSIALLSRPIFKMPWTLCFANGFSLAAVSPELLFPAVMVLISLKRGTKKGIPMVILAASSFDDIVAITMFAVFVSIAFDSIKI